MSTLARLRAYLKETAFSDKEVELDPDREDFDLDELDLKQLERAMRSKDLKPAQKKFAEEKWRAMRLRLMGQDKKADRAENLANELYQKLRIMERQIPRSAV